MKHDMLYYHDELRKYIHDVEHDETNQQALDSVKKTFLILFDMIKMIMISQQERYYGVFLMNFDLKIDFSSCFNAGVNIDSFPFRMIINPLLIGLKSLPEMIYILCHEIEHIILNHPVDGIKYNPLKDPITGLKLNFAMDASINDRLSADIEKNGFATISEPEKAITSTYLSENFNIHLKSLQAFDYYFERIPEKYGANGKGVNFIVIDKSEANQIVTEQKLKGKICIHNWTENDDPNEVSDIIRLFVTDVYNSMTGTMRGSLLEHHRELLDKLVEPTAITWKQLLKRYIGTIPYGQRKTKLRLNRRQPERYDISGFTNNRIIKLVIAIDTSGSMSLEALERIMVEIFCIIGTRMCDVTIIQCDCKIKQVYKVRSEKDVSYDIYGRGGTSFIPVIEYINADRYFRDAILIYFTDGEGDHSIPRPLTLRNLWVLYDEYCKLSIQNPYGEVLTMK